MLHSTRHPSIRLLLLSTKGVYTRYVYAADRMQSVNTTDYWGNVLCENGRYVLLNKDSTLTWCYVAKDNLGSNRVVRETGTGTKRSQINHYYPFGNTFGEYNHCDENPGLQRYKFNGKELDLVHGLRLYDYGARMYDDLLGCWTSVDPLAEKYYHISPYVFCLDNPSNLKDSDGKRVFAINQNAQRNILNTLSFDEKKYIRFTANNCLDNDLLNKYQGTSNNFFALKALANSDLDYVFSVSDKDVNGFSFYEKETNRDNLQNHSYGVTNIPNAENDPSPDDKVYINTASILDERMQAKNTAHEGYGYAYFYELHRKNPSIQPSHTFGIVGYSKEYDSYFGGIVEWPIYGKNNILLEEQIKKVEQEALDNYDKQNR